MFEIDLMQFDTSSERTQKLKLARTVKRAVKVVIALDMIEKSMVPEIMKEKDAKRLIKRLNRLIRNQKSSENIKLRESDIPVIEEWLQIWGGKYLG